MNDRPGTSPQRLLPSRLRRAMGMSLVARFGLVATLLATAYYLLDVSSVVAPGHADLPAVDPFAWVLPVEGQQQDFCLGQPWANTSDLNARGCRRIDLPVLDPEAAPVHLRLHTELDAQTGRRSWRLEHLSDNLRTEIQFHRAAGALSHPFSATEDISSCTPSDGAESVRVVAPIPAARWRAILGGSPEGTTLRVAPDEVPLPSSDDQAVTASIALSRAPRTLRAKLERRPILHTITLDAPNWQGSTPLAFDLRTDPIGLTLSREVGVRWVRSAGAFGVRCVAHPCVCNDERGRRAFGVRPLGPGEHDLLLTVGKRTYALSLPSTPSGVIRMVHAQGVGDRRVFPPLASTHRLLPQGFHHLSIGREPATIPLARVFPEVAGESSDGRALQLAAMHSDAQTEHAVAGEVARISAGSRIARGSSVPTTLRLLRPACALEAVVSASPQLASCELATASRLPVVLELSRAVRAEDSNSPHERRLLLVWRPDGDRVLARVDAVAQFTAAVYLLLCALWLSRPDGTGTSGRRRARQFLLVIATTLAVLAVIGLRQLGIASVDADLLQRSSMLEQQLLALRLGLPAAVVAYLLYHLLRARDPGARRAAFWRLVIGAAGSFGTVFLLWFVVDVSDRAWPVVQPWGSPGTAPWLPATVAAELDAVRDRRLLLIGLGGLVLSALGVLGHNWLARRSVEPAATVVPTPSTGSNTAAALAGALTTALFGVGITFGNSGFVDLKVLKVKPSDFVVFTLSAGAGWVLARVSGRGDTPPPGARRSIASPMVRHPALAAFGGVVALTVAVSWIGANLDLAQRPRLAGFIAFSTLLAGFVGTLLQRASASVETTPREVLAKQITIAATGVLITVAAWAVLTERPTIVVVGSCLLAGVGVLALSEIPWVWTASVSLTLALSAGFQLLQNDLGPVLVLGGAALVLLPLPLFPTRSREAGAPRTWVLWQLGISTFVAALYGLFFTLFSDSGVATGRLASVSRALERVQCARDLAGHMRCEQFLRSLWLLAARDLVDTNAARADHLESVRWVSLMQSDLAFSTVGALWGNQGMQLVLALGTLVMVLLLGIAAVVRMDVGAWELARAPELRGVRAVGVVLCMVVLWVAWPHVRDLGIDPDRGSIIVGARLVWTLSVWLAAAVMTLTMIFGVTPVGRALDRELPRSARFGVGTALALAAFWVAAWAIHVTSSLSLFLSTGVVLPFVSQSGGAIIAWIMAFAAVAAAVDTLEDGR